MAKRKTYNSKWEIYDIRTGETVPLKADGYPTIGLDRHDAEMVLGDMTWNAYKCCDNQTEEDFLNTYGIPYDLRRENSKYRKSVKESVVQQWNMYGY